jgi:hypothetical protein
MRAVAGGSFDPETILVMSAALEEAWASLLPQQQRATTKTAMANAVLHAAAAGERDRIRLRAEALTAVVVEPSESVLRFRGLREDRVSDRSPHHECGSRGRHAASLGTAAADARTLNQPSR